MTAITVGIPLGLDDCVVCHRPHDKHSPVETDACIDFIKTFLARVGMPA